MAYFERKNIWKTVFFSRGMALAMLMLVLFVGFAVFSIASKSLNAARDRRIAEQQAADLAKKQSDLEKKVAALGTDAGKEEVLRDQFPVVKPGEHVVVITDQDQGSGADAPSASAPATSTPGFWHFLRNLF